MEVKKGESLVIIGGSGTGKSVTLKCILGLLYPDKGKIEIDGQDILKMTAHQREKINSQIGMLFQGAALFDSLSVFENVIYPLEMFASMTKKEREERTKFCLQRVNLPERSYHLAPSEISGGMQKRVAIARAIVMNPLYLFCDEPNSGLDPQTSLIIDQLIHEITQEYNITTIVNTHDMNSIMEIGDHIMFLEKGEKRWEGTAEEIFHADCEELNNFVFASKLYRKIKEVNQ